MNLGRICEAAARYSDRYDEYVKTVGEDGEARYEGEALNWFNIFRDAVNEAYFEISRCLASPEKKMEIELGADRVIDLNALEPAAAAVCGVYRGDGMTEVEYVFRMRTVIEVTGARAGEKVMLAWQYLPERLEDEADEPVFSQTRADPMIYIALAVARVWQSERKMSEAQAWLSEYYRRLRAIRADMKPAKKRRLPRTMFR